MRSVNDLMKELGFREDGSNETKKAFIKNLLRAAYGEGSLPSQSLAVTPAPLPASPTPKVVHSENGEQQMSFDFESLEDMSAQLVSRRSG